MKQSVNLGTYLTDDLRNLRMINIDHRGEHAVWMGLYRAFKESVGNAEFSEQNELRNKVKYL